MPSQKDFFDGLKAQLQADAGLIAWAGTHFDTTLKFFDGAPAAPADGSGLDALLPDLPAVVIEPEDGAAPVVILGGPRRFRISIPMIVSIVWAEQDPADLHAQRLELPELVLNAVSKDHTLGGKVAKAELDPNASWLWETTLRPLVFFQTRVVGEYDRTFTS
jgi:hypothetical protein